MRIGRSVSLRRSIAANHPPTANRPADSSPAISEGQPGSSGETAAARLKATSSDTAIGRLRGGR